MIGYQTTTKSINIVTELVWARRSLALEHVPNVGAVAGSGILASVPSGRMTLCQARIVGSRLLIKGAGSIIRGVFLGFAQDQSRKQDREGGSIPGSW